VADLDAVLGRLEHKCRQTRISTPSLGDIAINSTAVLARAGKPMTPLQLLSALDQSVPEGANIQLDCVELSAMLLTTMGVRAK